MRPLGSAWDSRYRPRSVIGRSASEFGTRHSADRSVDGCASTAVAAARMQTFDQGRRCWSDAGCRWEPCVGAKQLYRCSIYRIGSPTCAPSYPPRKRRLTDAKEAVNLLKDKHLLLAVLRILKQIVPIRQTEAAELMIAMNRHHITLCAVTQRPPGPNSVPPDFGNGAPATASRN